MTLEIHGTVHFVMVMETENNEFKNKQLANVNIFLYKVNYLPMKKIIVSSLQVKDNLIKSENKARGNKQSNEVILKIKSALIVI